MGQQILLHNIQKINGTQHLIAKIWAGPAIIRTSDRYRSLVVWGQDQQQIPKTSAMSNVSGNLK